MSKIRKLTVIFIAVISLALLAIGITALARISYEGESTQIVAMADETEVTDMTDKTAATTEEDEEDKNSSTGLKAIAAGAAIGLAALGGALAMGIAISKSNEGIARQPEAEGKIRSTLMLGLVFIETAIIYALIVAILIVFVL